MKRILALSGGVVAFAVIVAALPSTTVQPAGTARVQVHCPAGPNGAFVTPVQVRVALGDSVEWRTTGNVVADSIEISPKDSTQAWPFDGAPSKGGASARANRARTRGTYSYNVRMLCRVPGGGTTPVVIDPDIIIF